MMKYKFLMLAGLLLGASSVFSQEVTSEQLAKIRSSLKEDTYTRAMENALSSNDIKKIAWNRENEGKVDQHFTYKVSVSGITDQKSSGRCWLFSSLNIFRPVVMNHLNIDKFEFSENYLYFWDLFEKSNLFLNNMIKTAKLPIDNEKVRWFYRSPVDDGGQWINFANLADKYGMVPRQAMEETHSSNNTRWMVRLICRKLREQSLTLRDLINEGTSKKAIEAKKTEMLGVIYRMLVLNLGTPPTEFDWRYETKDGKLSPMKHYTPKSFMKAVLGDVQLSDYVMLMNDPSRPYWKHYEIENYRNVQEGENWHYVNLPNDVIKKACIESIKNNDALYSSCDVGKQLNSDYGVLDVDNYDFGAVYGVKFGMDKKQRIITHDSGSTHGMALVAVDLNASGDPVKWQFENSWGSDAGYHGYLTFTDSWFNEYMFRIVVNKKYLSKKILDIYGQKPIVLPPWDPMF